MGELNKLSRSIVACISFTPMESSPDSYLLTAEFLTLEVYETVSRDATLFNLPNGDILAS